MKQQADISKGLYQYLEETGVLQSGNKATIEAATALYWRIYKREWRKAKRHAEKPFEILLTEKEEKIIQAAALKHGMSKTSYIKKAALTYSAQKYLVPNLEVLYEIKELLAINYDAILQLIQKGKGDGALQLVASLESNVLKLLFTPKRLSDGSR